MEEEERSRRDFLISVGAVAAIVAGLTGAGFLVNAALKADRTTTELSDKVRTAEGTATKLPDEYNVAVQYEHETATLNDKDLFGEVEKDSKLKVIVEFKEVYTVKKTYKGELLERKLTGYKIVGVSPK
jgi:hypothetical protein